MTTARILNNALAFMQRADLKGLEAFDYCEAFAALKQAADAAVQSERAVPVETNNDKMGG